MTSYFCCCMYQTLSTVLTTNISPKSPCLLMAHYIHFSACRCVSMTICGFWDTYTMFWLFMNPSRWKMVNDRQSDVLRNCWMNYNTIWQKTHLCCFLSAEATHTTWILYEYNKYWAHGGVVVKALRSRVRFLMVSLEFFGNIVLPVALWPWSQPSL
jgi:hypothetical protein